MNQHTKEPWRLGEDERSILDSTGEVVAGIPWGGIEKGYAERILSCVNAFEGIDDPTHFMSLIKIALKQKDQDIAIDRTFILELRKKLGMVYADNHALREYLEKIDELLRSNGSLTDIAEVVESALEYELEDFFNEELRGAVRAIDKWLNSEKHPDRLKKLLDVAIKDVIHGGNNDE